MPAVSEGAIEHRFTGAEAGNRQWISAAEPEIRATARGELLGRIAQFLTVARATSATAGRRAPTGFVPLPGDGAIAITDELAELPPTTPSSLTEPVAATVPS